ncbi:MAG: hypothetical protein HOP08_06705 [Cyclobacteriaceae bacterium]|nr:hypothetical protein [Cyclobacteriaceae bacterium]
MKIVMWINGEANQKALSNKIHALFPLTGIVIENRLPKRKITVSRVFEKVIEKLMLGSISKAWVEMLDFYEHSFSQFPDVTKLKVSDINNGQVLAFTRALDPDLIIVSGTSLIKNELLSLKAKIGIINLHTGLSPYLNGGPNCTNWCIANNEFHLIGNTVLWIDAGIDSGNIIATETSRFDGSEDLSAVHIKVMEHAHHLCMKAVSHLEAGGNSNHPQSEIGSGRTFYSRQWNLKEKMRLVKNFKNFGKEINSERISKLRSSLKMVSIDN